MPTNPQRKSRSRALEARRRRADAEVRAEMAATRERLFDPQEISRQLQRDLARWREMRIETGGNSARPEPAEATWWTPSAADRAAPAQLPPDDRSHGFGRE